MFTLISDSSHYTAVLSLAFFREPKFLILSQPFPAHLLRAHFPLRVPFYQALHP